MSTLYPLDPPATPPCIQFSARRQAPTIPLLARDLTSARPDRQGRGATEAIAKYSLDAKSVAKAELAQNILLYINRFQQPR
jgi:hypothetical protein